MTGLLPGCSIPRRWADSGSGKVRRRRLWTSLLARQRTRSTGEARNGHGVLARYLFYPGRRAYEAPTFRGCLRRRSYAYRTGWSALAPSLFRAHHSARPSRSRRTSVPPRPAPPAPRRPVPSACSACLTYAPLSTLLAEARPAAVSSCAARPRAAQQQPSEWCASIAPLPGSRTRTWV